MARPPSTAIFGDGQFDAEWAAFVSAFVHRSYQARLVEGPEKGLQRLHHYLSDIIDKRRAVVLPGSVSSDQVVNTLKLVNAESSGYLFDAHTPDQCGLQPLSDAVFRIDSYGSAAVSCGSGVCGFAKGESIHPPLRLILARDPKDLAKLQAMSAQPSQTNHR